MVPGHVARSGPAPPAGMTGADVIRILRQRLFLIVVLWVLSIILTGGFNEDALAVTEPNLITTFNLTRPGGFERTDILEFETGGPIDEYHTINIDGGRLNDLQNLTGGNLKGTLTVTNGEVERPSDDFTAAEVEDQRAPVRVFTFARVFVFIKRGAVEAS